MTEPKTDIYQFQSRLGQTLALWSGFSIGSAVVLALLGGSRRQSPASRRFWRGFASQFVGWGIVDLAIALLGLRSTEKRSASPSAHTAERQTEERRTLRKILWINSGLDIGYVGGGIALATIKGRDKAFWRGAGWGIVAQGGFLLILDSIHALLLRS